jgi:MFS family permease
VRPTVAYYVIAGLFTLASALIWGVNTLFLLDAGLDILGVFLANAAFTAGSVVFEIPTGLFADTRGRRASFLLSVALLVVTTGGYVIVARAGGGLLPFAIVSVLMGLGFTFYSGAVEAWLVDALEHSGYAGRLDRVFARGSMVSGAAMLVGTLAGGLLGDVDLALPYVARCLMLLAAFVVAWIAMHDVGFTPRALRAREIGKEMRRVAEDSLQHGWAQRPVRLLMIVSAVQWGFMTWAFYAWQPYFLELLGRDAVWVAGAAASAIAGAMILGNAIVEALSRFCGRRTTLLVWAAGALSVAAVLVGTSSSFWLALGGMVLLGMAIGVTGPVKQAFLHQSVPSAQRATVVSLDSMFGNGGGIVGQAGLGWLSRARSIEQGYLVGGMATVAAVPLLLAVRSAQASADRVLGARAGADAPCAAQGIPSIAGIDAQARGRAAG